MIWSRCDLGIRWFGWKLFHGFLGNNIWRTKGILNLKKFLIFFIYDWLINDQSIKCVASGWVLDEKVFVLVINLKTDLYSRVTCVWREILNRPSKMTTNNEKTIIVKTATELEYRINVRTETSLETFKDHFHLNIFL